MSKDDGGIAFPSQERVCVNHTSSGDRVYELHACGGMTLRDYFAAKALLGFMTNKYVSFRAGLDGFAVDAYKMADAMLKERNK